MPSVREFFSTEASEYLDKLGNLVAGLNDSAVDPAELHKVTRALRGSAQMAREDRIYKVAVGLEATARALAGKAVQWNTEVSNDVSTTLQDLRVLVQGAESDDAQEVRTQNALQRLAPYARAATNA